MVVVVLAYFDDSFFPLNPFSPTVTIFDIFPALRRVSILLSFDSTMSEPRYPKRKRAEVQYAPVDDDDDHHDDGDQPVDDVDSDDADDFDEGDEEWYINKRVSPIAVIFSTSPKSATRSLLLSPIPPVPTNRCYSGFCKQNWPPQHLSTNASFTLESVHTHFPPRCFLLTIRLTMITIL